MRNERKIWLKNVIFWTETEVKKKLDILNRKKVEQIVEIVFFCEAFEKNSNSNFREISNNNDRITFFFRTQYGTAAWLKTIIINRPKFMNRPHNQSKNMVSYSPKQHNAIHKKKTEAAVYLSVERIRIAIYFRIRLLIWHKQTKTKWKTINKNGKVLPANFLLSIASPKKSTL